MLNINKLLKYTNLSETIQCINFKCLNILLQCYFYIFYVFFDEKNKNKIYIYIYI